MSTALIFVDTNIPMYAMGTPHPHKEPCLQWFKAVAEGHREAVTDVEVLQEILYRYWSIGAMGHGTMVYEQMETIVPTIYSVTRSDVDRAKELLQEAAGIEPRDAVHAAVMLNRDVTTIISYDRHFDRVKGLKRIQP